VASHNTAVFRLRSLRELRSARRPVELPSPLYAARLVDLRLNSGAAPETSERYVQSPHRTAISSGTWPHRRR
jgi:hypothetical protein